jgi:hypothetical protein
MCRILPHVHVGPDVVGVDAFVCNGQLYFRTLYPWAIIRSVLFGPVENSETMKHDFTTLYVTGCPGTEFPVWISSQKLWTILTWLSQTKASSITSFIHVRSFFVWGNRASWIRQVGTQHAQWHSMKQELRHSIAFLTDSCRVLYTSNESVPGNHPTFQAGWSRCAFLVCRRSDWGLKGHSPPSSFIFIFSPLHTPSHS